MPSPNRSAAAVLAHAQRPVRAVLESDSVEIGCLTATDVIKQMRPHPAARMCGTASRTSRIDVSALASNAALKATGGGAKGKAS